MSNIPSGYFRSHYELHGRDWIRTIPVEDRQAFLHEMFIASNCGKNGGIVRAMTAKRNPLGRFISDKEKSNDNC